MEYLQEKAKRGNKSAQKDLDNLVLPESLFLWEAFSTLSKSRIAGIDGYCPISVSEISSFLRDCGVCASDIPHMIQTIQAVDAAYLKWMADNGAS